MEMVPICRNKFGLWSARCVSSLRRSSTSSKYLLDLSTKLKIEEKWSTLINQRVAFDESSSQPKCFVCPMFPYPSGNLHMGHVRVYTISDAIARFQRLNGKEVLHPIGFDSFGLPAENAALENKVNPEDWTNWNISKMREQLKKLGYSFDWSREIITSDPQYFKFTQYIFLLMYKHGLVYRKKALVNWDPVDRTVLADEQVDSAGRSWRSGALVEKKMLKQWFIRCTNFAESLRDGLDTKELAAWRDIVKLQKHWLGDCDGAEFQFDFYLNDKKISSERIWVEKPEHISRAAFIAVATPDHLGLSSSDLAAGVTANNPFTNNRLPVVVVPQDEIKYPDSCIVKLCIPSQCEEDAAVATRLGISFNPERDFDNYDERRRICRLGVTSGIGGHLKSSKLRDWLISRQRRWGTPIPIVHCGSCGPVPVKLEDLPVILPKTTKTPPSASCPNCGKEGVRELDTMDTFVDSSWYYLRYIDPFNQMLPFDQSKVNKLMPVDVYIGGKEHATLHLYYARFVSHFLHSIGLVPVSEPFKRLLVQGMVMGKTYYLKESKKAVHSSEVTEKDGRLLHNSGEEVVVKWEKMSKSKHNGVEPSDMLKRFGVDTTRLLILGEVSPTSDRLWKEEAFDGILNFQDKLWSLIDGFVEARKNIQPVDPEKLQKIEEKLNGDRNFQVKGITFNYSETYQLSVAISRMQGFIKTLRKYDTGILAKSIEYEKILAALLVMLAPMAPHFASELWSMFQSAPNRLQTTSNDIQWDKTVLEQRWPRLDDHYLLDLLFKVNNAVKGDKQLSYSSFKLLTKEEALKMALADSKVVDFLDGRDIISSDWSVIDSHSATINLQVDHTLQRTNKQASATS